MAPLSEIKHFSYGGERLNKTKKRGTECGGAYL
jgi:hypothetical protein